MCVFSKQENNQAGTHNFDKTFESNVFILFFGGLAIPSIFLTIKKNYIGWEKMTVQHSKLGIFH